MISTTEVTPIVHPTESVSLPYESSISEYIDTDTSVEVTFTNSDGWIFSRTVNIPRNENGSIDEEELNQIVNDQNLGLSNKVRLGVCKFVDPNAEPEETPVHQVP